MTTVIRNSFMLSIYPYFGNLHFDKQENEENHIFHQKNL